MRLLRWIKPIHLIALAVLGALVLLRVGDPGPLQTLRLKTFDLYQQIEPREYAEKQPVAIIDLDEESLAAYGQWPWPRTLVADLVRQLTRYQVAAIGFDIVFAEPDRTSPGEVVDTFRGIDPETEAILRSLPSNEEVLAQALRESGRSILGQSTAPRADPDLGERKSIKTNFGVKALKGATTNDAGMFAFAFRGLVRNRVELEEAAQGIGVFTIVPESDGIVRRLPLVVRVGDTLYPTLVVEMLRVATGQKSLVVQIDRAGISSVIVAGFPIPTDGQGRTWVHYSPYSRDRYVSAKDVLEGTVPPERLAGHFALIGTSAIGLQDIRATPLDDAVPGVEVHAQLLETIFAQSFLQRPNWAIGAEVTALVAVGLLLIVLVPLLGAIWTLLLGSTLIGALIGGSWYLYIDAGMLLDMVYVAIATFLLYGALTYMNYIREETQRRQVRGAFSRYMSPELVEQLARDPSKLKLGGEMRNMTLLFCDIRGFTTISEQFDAEGLTSFINRFLTPMTELILEGRGTIDKYMGDCIMAFWNAPIDDPDHVKHACHSALAMMERLERLNEELRAEAEAENRKYIPIRVGIGLNTGECCVGNMGSDMRFDYSVLGDDVNLASRLEGQSKTYGVDIVIGKNTQAVAEDFATLELDLIQVKGKTVPVRIYTLLGEEEFKKSAEFRTLEERHGEMMTAYRAQDWKAVRRKIEECRGLASDGRLEALYDLYLGRVEAYEAEPPGEDWEGVFIAKTK